ncbi:MAG: hypothetical protein PHH26_09415, partial [Candidatus Thermoplasmatota archaeon]|nr:hypothetical protein [Candidatus Thermoplasmatota archaeon]
MKAQDRIIFAIALVGIVAMIFSVPAACAQALPLYAVEVTCGQPDGTVEAGGTALYTISVKNTGTGLLGAGQETIDLSVVKVAEQGNWTIRVDPAQIVLNSGATSSASLSVTPANTNKAGDFIKVKVRAFVSGSAQTVPGSDAESFTREIAT